MILSFLFNGSYGMLRMDLYALYLDYNGGVQTVENKNFPNRIQAMVPLTAPLFGVLF
jgi:hypothetical protein